jgi:hypothetical protein
MFRRFLLCLAFLSLLALPASAAVTPNSPVTPQTPNRGVVQFLQGTDSAGTYKTLYAAGSNGSDCSALWLTTNDGSATHLITVQIVNSTVKYGGTAVTTVASAGFANGVPPMNLFAPTIWVGLPLNSDGNPFLRLISGDTVQMTFATNLTSSTVVNAVISCADY